MALDENARPSILLIAGDVSGDIHTARLASMLLERHPDWKLHALGGPHLKKTIAGLPGCCFLSDTSNCSAIGLISASKIYFRCLTLRDRVLEFLRTHPVDAVVLCDWGGFNSRMLPYFRELGIPVLYYFPPRSWQRSGLPGLGIAQLVTRVATPFEWSANRLLAAGCRAEWVGHPLLESIRPKDQRSALRTEFGVSEHQQLIALLPGSRRSELRVLAPILAKTAKRLKARRAVQFAAVVPEQLRAEARRALPEWIPIWADRAADLLLACDAAIVKTGTATLEAALAGAPQVAVYSGSWVQGLEWYLLWAWKRIPFVAMPNIILQRMVVPELLAINCTSGKIERAITPILEDGETRRQMLQDYSEIRRALGSELPVSATMRTVQILEEMLAEVNHRVPAHANTSSNLPV